MLLKVFALIFFATQHTLSAASLERSSSCGKKNWQCNDGSCIRTILKCDGQADCLDGSDESKETCFDNVCSSDMFQCKYGACIYLEGLCNEEVDCVDSSDEDEVRCDKLKSTPKARAIQNCELPPFPEHGNYSVFEVPELLKDFGTDLYVSLTVSCEPGYKPDGFPMIFCRKGIWERRVPQCYRPCQLKKHPNLKYYCPTIKNNARECGEQVSSGASVITECKDRKYFSPHTLKCSDGEWDRQPICKPECGRVTQEPVKLTPVGDQAPFSSAPWHAILYSKLTRSQVCGGTLISDTVAVSAAHCFWDKAVGLLPAPTYRVIAGTMHRQSTSYLDKYGQQRNVDQIIVPDSFDGLTNTLEYDIALVTVATPFQFSAFVTPVCLDFDPEFNKRQLSENMYGKFVSWDKATDVLKPLDLPAAICANEYSTISQLNITGDQICAGQLNENLTSTTPDRSSAGTGLAFPNTDDSGVERFYLQGVASTIGEPIVFTQIIKHKLFILSKIGTV